jgi:hypothetical protein
VRWRIVLCCCLVACGKKATVGEAPQQPTVPECRAAIANLARLAPGSAGATDIDECLRLPRAAVACLAAARSPSDVEPCVSANARSRFGKGGTGPAEPIGAPEVTAEECQAAAMAAKNLRHDVKESVADLVDECVRSATKGDVKCLMAAGSADEAKRCGLFGLE